MATAKTYPGLFVMIDGLDGVGKDTIMEALKHMLIDKGKSVFELKSYWSNYGFHPELKDFVTSDVVMSSEPTSVGIGSAIRREIIANHTGRQYSARATANAYALDRLVLYKRVLLPALAVGKWITQSRGVSTSLAYQPLQAQTQQDSLPLEEVMALEGNVLALENAPDLLIIPTVADVDELARRLASRQKKDDAIFENVPFQKQLKLVYESDSFRELFEKRGTIVRYFDAGVSVEHSRSEAVRILEEFLRARGKIA